MHSAIYQGVLRHRRFHPKSHEFSYRSTLFYIDLDELPGLFDGAKHWSLNGKSLGQFCRADYLGESHDSLITSVRMEVTRQLGFCPQGPIRMLTNLRMWGMCFNPVTLYYVFDLDAETPALILAQVNNTPWNERHCYIVPCDATTGKAKQAFTKQFHVSPFNPLDMEYRWISSNPAKNLVVHMENHRADLCHMDATLTLEREEWSATSLQKILWQQPWLTLKIPVAIYWQAFKLLLKRVPLYDHKKFHSDKNFSDTKIVAEKEQSATQLTLKIQKQG